MTKMCKFYGIFVLLLLNFHQFGDAKMVHPNEAQKAALGQTIKSMLGFEQLPDTKGPYLNRGRTVAEEYMEAIFTEFRSQHPGIAGNMVRSVLPRIGRINNRDLLVFPLETITSEEHPLKAEIHLNFGKRPRYKSEKKSNRMMKCYTLNDANDLQELRLIKSAPEWVAFDVLGTLLRNKRPIMPLICGKPRRKSEAVHQFSPGRLRKFNPFLVIFAHDRTNLASKLQKVPLTTSTSTRSKRSVNPAYYAYTVGEPDPTSPAAMEVKAIQSTGPESLMDRQEEENIKNSDEFQGPTIPYPPGYHRRKFGRKPKNKGGRNRQLPQTWMKATYYDLNGGEQSVPSQQPTVVLLQPAPTQPCQLYDLVVEFRDIGWGDWIISPKSFEAHYCAGVCPFPLDKDVNPTNHAMIQSIIHTIGLNPQVPAPCCAPEKMDSMTLLYFDERQNVVLKNFPRMSVKSCGCL